MPFSRAFIALRCLPVVAIAACIALGGCAAAKVADDTLGDLTKSALEATGLRKPELPTPPAIPQAEALRLPREVALRIYAADDLNHDAEQHPLSLVLRVYRLKSSAAFLQAPYDAFAASGADKAFLGEDVLDVREFTLVAGQQYTAQEKVPREAQAVGIVALFNAPAPRRWKFAFDASAAERTGLVIGAHGCALTVTQGQPLDAPADAQRLAGTQCGP
jgi:type VI secretion system protein VasD